MHGVLACSYGSVWTGRTQQNHFSPWPETLKGSATRGCSRDWKTGGGSPRSAPVSSTQRLTRLLLPCSSSPFPRQPLNPCCSFSVFHFAQLAVLPTPRPETLHKLSGIPSSKSGLSPGASSELRDTSTSWLTSPLDIQVSALPGPPSKLLSVLIIPVSSLSVPLPWGSWLLPAAGTSVIP